MKLELPELYDYQLGAVDRLRTGIENGAHGQVLSLPTGAGKLVIARDMIAKAWMKGSQTVFLVDRHDLLDQTSRRFFEVGLPHGAISGGIDFGYHERVQIWMVQTLAARGWPMMDIDLVVIDECDRMYRFLTESLPKRTCPYIGLSATPTARGMANVYRGGVVQTATTNQLLEAGRLTPFIVRPAVEIDTNGMPLVGGEFDAGEIQVRGRRIIGDIVSSWVSETNKHFGGPVKTMLFGASVDHVAEICADFQAAGYDFRHVSGRDDRQQRDETMAAFRHGEFPGLGSVELLTRGIDIPDVLCLICARPYNKALAAYLQMLGRLMRTAPGKTIGLVIDHCIERNQRVLTHRGPVAICRVRDDDLLWDGEEWVTHGGAVHVGRKPIIEYAGLRATRDHKVWTRRGWLSFGEAAETLEPIVQTGSHGAPVRIGADRFRHGRTSRPGWRTDHARPVRVRDLWLSIHHFLSQLAAGAHKRLSRVQPATTHLSALAVDPMRSHEGPVHQPEGIWLRPLWRARYRIPVAVAESCGTVDRRQSRHPEELRGTRSRPDQERGPLRAGEHPVGNAPAEPKQHASYHRDNGQDASLQARISRCAVRGRDALQAALERLVVHRDRRTVVAPIEETQREVWDIRDAGPRNRFTCQGLLTHNSGNHIGFYDEIAEFFETGIRELDHRKFSRASRKAPSAKERKEITCRGCGIVLTPRAEVCPACGMERKRARPSGVVTVPGKLISIEAISSGKRGWKGSEAELWTACCTAGARGIKRHGDPARAERQAKAHFRDLTGRWPPRHYRFVPGDRVPRAIQRKLDKNYRMWKARQKEARQT